jgi:hypothetical protein
MTERGEEQRLPMLLGSAVVVRSSDVGAFYNVEVHVYRFRRSKRFPLTRNILLKLIDTLELEYRHSKGKGITCRWKCVCNFLKFLFYLFVVIVLCPFVLAVSPLVMIYEMIGADEAWCGFEESDLYQREWFRIDRSSWCPLFSRQCLETDPVKAGPSPRWVSSPRVDPQGNTVYSVVE